MRPFLEEDSTQRGLSKRAIIVAVGIVAVLAIAGIAACTLASSQESSQPQQSSASQKTASSQSQQSSASQKSGSSTDSKSSQSSESSQASADSQSDGPKPANQQDQEPSQGGGTSSASEPGKQRVWVVDVLASTTVIHHDAVMTQEPGPVYSKCTICGADITGCESGHTEQHALEGILNASWTTAQYPPEDVVLEPAWDEVVEVPEQGHWEYR